LKSVGPVVSGRRCAAFGLDGPTSLIVVKPETVVGWHRAGISALLEMAVKSRRAADRQPTAEIRTLIRRVAEENPTWGAPKIHGELLKLGLTVSERTVARYLRRVRRRGDPGPNGWLTFQ
jgi:hypothetical protein